MDRYLYVTVDTNDANYVSTINEIYDWELEVLRPLIEAIKNFKPYDSEGWVHYHNWPTKEARRGDLGEKSPEEIYENVSIRAINLMEEFLPYCEIGSHSITEIKVVNVLEDFI